MIDIPQHVRGLVFDCDGTIADTMPLHYRAWVRALGEAGCDFPQSVFYELAGMPTSTIIQLLNQRHGWHLPVQEMTDRKEGYFQELLPGVTPSMPVVDLVKKYAGKLPMAVATGGSRDLCARTLEFLRLKQYFAAMVTSDDVQHGKPAPDIFLEAARRLNVPAKDCCAFEDGELGLTAARAAGMMAVDVRPLL